MKACKDLTITKVFSGRVCLEALAIGLAELLPAFSQEGGYIPQKPDRVWVFEGDVWYAGFAWIDLSPLRY